MIRGIISGIKRMEIHDGDGIRTTVFLKGCPLKCIWCHNPESLSRKIQIAVFHQKCIACGSCNAACPAGAVSLGKIDRQRCTQCGLCAESCPAGALVRYGEEWEPGPLAKVLAQDAPFFKSSGGGVTLSGGECLAQPEFAEALAKELRQMGIGVYVDTCGFVNRETLDRIIPYTDRFLYDIKAIDPEVHKACTGQENGIILENLRYLSERGCSIEIRYPLIKGYNDGECERIGQFLQDLPGICKIKVLQYHRFAASRYEALGMECTLPDTETTPEDVQSAVDILRSFGLNAVNGITDD